MTKKVVALLDDSGLLVGYKTVKKPQATDVVVPADCDLPTDNTYRWDKLAGQFIPLGHGHGKPVVPPLTTEMVMRRLIELVPSAGEDLALMEWGNWYDTNLRRADEERLTRLRRLMGRTS